MGAGANDVLLLGDHAVERFPQHALLGCGGFQRLECRAQTLAQPTQAGQDQGAFERHHVCGFGIRNTAAQCFAGGGFDIAGDPVGFPCNGCAVTGTHGQQGQQGAGQHHQGHGNAIENRAEQDAIGAHDGERPAGGSGARHRQDRARRSSARPGRGQRPGHVPLGMPLREFVEADAGGCGDDASGAIAEHEFDAGIRQGIAQPVLQHQQGHRALDDADHRAIRVTNRMRDADQQIITECPPDEAIRNMAAITVDGTVKILAIGNIAVQPDAASTDGVDPLGNTGQHPTIAIGDQGGDEFRAVGAQQGQFVRQYRLRDRLGVHGGQTIGRGFDAGGAAGQQAFQQVERGRAGQFQPRPTRIQLESHRYRDQADAERGRRNQQHDQGRAHQDVHQRSCLYWPGCLRCGHRHGRAPAVDRESDALPAVASMRRSSHWTKTSRVIGLA